MRKIVTFLFASLILITGWAQVSDSQINTDINQVRTQKFDPVRTALPMQDLHNSKISTLAAQATGTDTYVVSNLNGQINAYMSGQTFPVYFQNANTGPATININGAGAKALVKNSSTALSASDIAAGRLIWIYYDGTNFRISLPGSGGGGGGGTVTDVRGSLGRTTSTGGDTPVIDIDPTFESGLGKVTSRIDQNNVPTTSAQLGSIIPDKTGSGNLVFNGSPSLTGTPTVPTASSGTNNTQAASTAYVTNAISTAAAGYQPVNAYLNDIAVLPTGSGVQNYALVLDGTGSHIVSTPRFPNPATLNGQILVYNGTTYSALNVGTSTQFLKGGTTPSYSSVSLLTDVIDALPSGQGGVPSGGTSSQVLTKNSNTSYDYSWATPSGGGGGIGGSTGSVDKALIVANGTGGATVQGIPITASATGDLTLGSSQSGANRTITADGSATNVGIILQAKGNGDVHVANSLSTINFHATQYAQVGGNSSAGGQLVFYEDTDNGINHIDFNAPSSLANDNPYTLPDAYPSADGYSLTGNTDGTLHWTNIAGGGGGGGVSSITFNSPLTGGTITTTGSVGITNSAADGTTKGVVALVASDFNDNGSGLISLDIANIQAADATHKGLLAAADYNTFLGKQSTGLSWLLAGTSQTFTAPVSFTGTTTNTLKYEFGSLGAYATPTPGAGNYLRNPTPAISGTQQYSPVSTWEAQVFNTTSSVSQPVRYDAYVQGVQGTSVNGVFAIRYSLNNGTETTAFSHSTSTGVTSFSGGVTSSGPGVFTTGTFSGSLSTSGNLTATQRVITGGFQPATVSKSANYTLTINDYTVRFDATTGSLTASLPAASTATNSIFVIKKIDSSVNTVTVDASGSETLDGALTFILSLQYKYVIIQSNGTSWDIIGSN